MTAAAAPSLLLIGSDPDVTRVCKASGVDLVIVYGPAVKDGDDDAIPADVPSVFVQDQRLPESVLSALHRAGLAAGPSGRGFDAVLTNWEQSLVHAAVLAQLLGCRGHTPDVAVRFRDKWLQKAAIRAAGLPTARSTVIDDIAYPDELPELDSWPRVLKPVHGVAVKYTALVSDQAELREAAARFYRKQPSYRTYVAEEFSQGDEWIADGVVFGGEVVFLSVATYEEPCLSVLRNKTPMTFRRFDPTADAEAFRIADPFVRRCIAALGLVDGVFHMEFFHDPGTGELVFGECAARLGGALVPEEIWYKFGVDLAEEAVRCALGWQPRLDVKVSPDSIGNTYLLGPPGTVLSAPSPAEVLAQEGTRHVAITRLVGEVMPDSFDDVGARMGMAVVAAPTPDALYRRMAELRSWFESRLIVVPPNPNERKLRNWSRRVWPDVDLDDARYAPPGADPAPLAGLASPGADIAGEGQQ
jgi:biotin carboxylase